MPSSGITVRPRLRIDRGETALLGPGKIGLLEALGRTESLTEAAAELGMSYMRAWKLLKALSTTFREPLFHSERGGASHGRTTLTNEGRAVVVLYRQMEAEATAAIAEGAHKLLGKLK